MACTPYSLFPDPLHEDVGTWLLNCAPYRGGDYDEVAAVAVGGGGDGPFCDPWVASSSRLWAAADQKTAAGHRSSACDL